MDLEYMKYIEIASPPYSMLSFQDFGVGYPYYIVYCPSNLLLNIIHYYLFF